MCKGLVGGYFTIGGQIGPCRKIFSRSVQNFGPHATRAGATWETMEDDATPGVEKGGGPA